MNLLDSFPYSIAPLLHRSIRNKSTIIMGDIRLNGTGSKLSKIDLKFENNTSQNLLPFEKAKRTNTKNEK